MQNPEIKAEAEKVAVRADALEKELAGEQNLTLPQNRKPKSECA